MSAISSFEVTVIPFTRRPGVSVQAHMLNIHQKCYHTVVEGMEFNTEEVNVPMNKI